MAGATTGGFFINDRREFSMQEVEELISFD